MYEAGRVVNGDKIGYGSDCKSTKYILDPFAFDTYNPLPSVTIAPIVKPQYNQFGIFVALSHSYFAIEELTPV
jgi:hypothetical protein